MNWWTQQKLKSGIAQIRLNTVKQLARKGGQEALECVAAMVTDPDLEVRRAVVESLSGSKDKLLGILQQKYGRTKEKAQREIDDFLREENPERKVS